jgi:hypothetical protein
VAVVVMVVLGLMTALALLWRQPWRFPAWAWAPQHHARRRLLHRL